MSQFDKRGDSFENKFAHDEALQFKATARRNKLLGLWAAEKLGKSAAEAEAYARTVVSADLEEAGEDDVFRKIRADLDAAKERLQASDSRIEIRRVMTRLIPPSPNRMHHGKKFFGFSYQAVVLLYSTLKCQSR